MDVVGKVSSFITQGMYSVATPFHPFGGAVDIIVVKQQDGTFRSTPWYVRFGKFQGVLKGAEKIVRIEVNGVEANFNMYLDNSGEAYFVREVHPSMDDNESDSSNIDFGLKENDLYGQEVNDFNNGEVELQNKHLNIGMSRLQRVESDTGYVFYEFQDDIPESLEGSVELPEFASNTCDTLESVEDALESEISDSEVVLVSVDGHILTAPISSSEGDGEDVELDTPQFHLGPGAGTEEYDTGEATWTSDYLSDLHSSAHSVSTGMTGDVNSEALSPKHLSEPCEGDQEHLFQTHETQASTNNSKEVSINSSSGSTSSALKKDDVFKSCLELSELAVQSINSNKDDVGSSDEIREASEDPHKKSPGSPLGNSETEKRNHDILRTEDGLSPTDSEHPISVSSPELQVEAATHERNTLDMDDDGSDSKRLEFVSSNQEPQDQMDVDLAVESKPSGEEVHASEDGHSKSELVEPHKAAPSEDMKSEDGHSKSELVEPHKAAPGEDMKSEDGHSKSELVEPHKAAPSEDMKSDVSARQEISLSGNVSHAGVESRTAEDAVDPSHTSIKPDIIVGNMETAERKKDDSSMTSARWRLWPIPFRRVKTLEHCDSNASVEEVFVDSECFSPRQLVPPTPTARVATDSPRKQIIRTNVPTTDQIASLNLKEGQNMVNFVFSTRVLGSQKVEAHIYLWKWNARIVISDVDGTITKSDVLGQFMPLVGKDWTHSGIARFFSAIKENGYQLLFLSARAIVQAYLTKNFLFNLKQDGKSLPTGPVVISPDGLFPSLYREVIRRAPHEFKIACLEDIKALFPADYNPFYAGFGNRDTDELSYRKIGIPKGKIFIINPKGEVAINHRVEVKAYTSFHTLVNDMFPPTSLVEQEDYNSWNYWKMPLPDVE
ncbi:Phosphatidate phosphatase PAH1 [Sesamum alatum]|uniref:Phosphatidate phosphatase PAH1 n=1 Tax=Sesamum alatum TaxID=300844 RepID=A0AAE2CEG6_9LAMI|nr:Phosphatidate phosphatase PAH1 [Sesamum alatum]